MFSLLLKIITLIFGPLIWHEDVASHERSCILTLPETNIFAPENGWLEDESFPFGQKAYFQGFLLLDAGRVHILQTKKHVNLEPQTTIYKWMFGETTIFYIKIWNHPIETSIYRWLFGVPGISKSTKTSFKDQTHRTFNSDDPRISCLKPCANVPWFLAAEAKVDFQLVGINP